MSIKKVLIVDDCPTDRLHASNLLKKRGFIPITAENGEQAMSMVKAERPDLVLMDVAMPGRNGFQITRDMTRHPDTVGIPIIICSEKPDETYRIWGLRQGARDYLTKPLDEMLLHLSIELLEEGVPAVAV